MGPEDPVARPQVARHSNCNSLLPDREVAWAPDLASGHHVANALLRGADQNHASQRLDQPRLIAGREPQWLMALVRLRQGPEVRAEPGLGVSPDGHRTAEYWR
jgi:hypothetical protein